MIHGALGRHMNIPCSPGDTSYALCWNKDNLYTTFQTSALWNLVAALNYPLRRIGSHPPPLPAHRTGIERLPRDEAIILPEVFLPVK